MTLAKRISFLLFLPALVASAQEPELREHSGVELMYGRQPIRGRFYFVIEDVRTGRVLRRGVEEANGDIHKGLLLPSNRRIREGFLHARTLKIGYSEFTTPGPGSTFRFPNTFFFDTQADELDTDQDGLPDSAEFIVGTDPNKADTDGDGLLDGVEVRQGSNPMDSNPPVTGIIAQADASGQAQDLDALDDLVVLATGSTGVSVFNVGAGTTPVLRAQVDTPGNATRVAIGAGFVAVADGSSGVGILLPTANGPFAQFHQEPRLNAECSAVAAAGTIAFAGFTDGELRIVGVRSDGISVLQSLLLGTAGIRDLFLSGDSLYALVGDTLTVLHLDGAFIEVIGSVPSPTYTLPSRRVFVGGDVAYVVHGMGYNTFDVSNPASPRLIKTEQQSELGWKHLVANGSGLGLVAASPNLSFDGSHNVRLYDVSNPASVSGFLSPFEIAGVARSVRIYNGLAYVAVTKDPLQPVNGPSLQVLSYLPTETGRQAPGITLTASFSISNSNTARAEEGKLARLTAQVTDDVQVRNVAFYVDGTRVALDGNFPFETRFTTPTRTASKTNFVIHAVATDTGGNTARTPDVVVELTGDTTAPRALDHTPVNDGFETSLSSVVLRFNEPIRPGSLNAGSFRITRAGDDGELGTADDALLGNVTFRVLEEASSVVANLGGAPFPADSYEVRVASPLSDLAGNVLAIPMVWRFVVGSVGSDSDGDGLPDFLERSFGLNPSNGDDAQTDLDGDGLGTLMELRVGLNPRLADSDGNGIRDDFEDSDGDGLDNRTELQQGTDPLRADTDGDGFQDGDEVAAGSDPRSRSSIPFVQRLSLPVSVLNAAPTDSERFVQRLALPVSVLNTAPTASERMDRIARGVIYRNQ